MNLISLIFIQVPTDVYTHTLSTDHLLVVDISADFGEIIITAVLLFLLATLVGDFLFRLVYRR